MLSLEIPENPVPIQKINFVEDVALFIKREDLINEEISGNKYWKLFYNVNNYLSGNPENPRFITFGGAFSNHISAVSALGKKLGIETLGIIRGEELFNKFNENPTLKFAKENGMNFEFVSRESYRDKDFLTKKFKEKFPSALIIPEGGTNAEAVEGVHHMLDSRTESFDYLCAAVGTGGTLAGISKFAEAHQKVLGFPVVKDASLENEIFKFSQRKNFELMDAAFGGYGKISSEVVRFMNNFYQRTGIPLDPIYTGKMMLKLFDLIEKKYFPRGSKILAFHTGGLQGIAGANDFLTKKNSVLINFN